MGVKRSTALSAVRTRIADTQTTYQYSDAFLKEQLTASLREMETEIRDVAPEYFLTYQDRAGYTDALDPGTYEFYALPADLSRLEWIERSDLSWRPKIWQYKPHDAEYGRFGGRANWPGTVAAGGETFSVPIAEATESVSIFGDRFRILPAPSASGPIYRAFYVRAIRIPEGDDDILDVPAQFEEPLLLSTGIRALERDQDPLAQTLSRRLAADLDRAKRNLTGRNGRRMILKASW